MAELIEQAEVEEKEKNKGGETKERSNLAESDEAEATEPLRYEAPMMLASVDGTDDRREYKVRFIRSGRVVRRNGQPSNWLIPPETLRAAVAKLNGVPSYIDHAQGSFFSDGSPSVRDLAGVTFGAEFNEADSSIDGGLRLYERDDLAWLRMLLDQIVLDQAAGLETPGIGLSIVFYGQHGWEGPDEAPMRVTRSIDEVESCDIVFKPGADGRFKEILAALNVRRTFSERQTNQVNDRERSEEQAERPRSNNNLVSGGVQMKYCSNCGAKLQTGVEHHCSDGAQAQVALAGEQGSGEAPPLDLWSRNG